MNRRAFVIRHVHFEDLGLLAPVLEARGFEIRYNEAWDADFGAAFDATSPSCSADPSASTTRATILSKREFALSARRSRATSRCWVCASGPRSSRRPRAGPPAAVPEEIGWAPLRLTTQGLASPLVHLRDIAVLHWHGEVCDCRTASPRWRAPPPAGTRRSRLDTNVLTLQFRAEAGDKGIEPWLIGHTLEIGTADGVSVSRMRSDTKNIRPRP